MVAGFLGSAAAAAVLLLVSGVHGHGGHSEVPEGQIITAEPLVRASSLQLMCWAIAEMADRSWIAGLYLMDSYPSYGRRVRVYLSNRHGLRREYSRPIISMAD
jgi:hypothetical protein